MLTTMLNAPPPTLAHVRMDLTIREEYVLDLELLVLSGRPAVTELSVSIEMLIVTKGSAAVMMASTRKPESAVSTHLRLE